MIFTLFKGFLVLLVLIHLNLGQVLSESNETGVNVKYIGIHSKTQIPCVLSAFKASVIVNPFNKTFVGNTFSDITPETSAMTMTDCEAGVSRVVKHYYLFRKNISETHFMGISFGFEFHYDFSIDLHIKYTEDLDIGMDSNGKPKFCTRGHHCWRMSANYHLTTFKAGTAVECSHNWRVNLKDIKYPDETSSAVNYGSFVVDLDYYRLDITNTSKSFHEINYCLLDRILTSKLLLLFAPILAIIFGLCLAKCLCDCLRNRQMRPNKRRFRAEEESSVVFKHDRKAAEESNGQPIEL